MAILSFPSASSIHRARWLLRGATIQHISPLTRRAQTLEIVGARWLASFELVPMRRADAEAWMVFLMRLNGRAGRFYAGDPSAVAPRAVPASVVASGTVSNQNARISLAAGRAFCDLVGEDLSGYADGAHIVVITDSAGKTLRGWLGSVGGGATVSDERLTNGGFTSSTSGWFPGDCTLASVAGGEAGNALEITRTGGTYQVAGQTVAAAPGELLRLTAYVKSGTSGNENSMVAISDGSGVTNVVLASSGVWQQNTVIWRVALAQATTTAWLNKATATAGTMLFDTASLVHILTPSATGATVMTTRSGMERAWISEESGFNRNDASGYSYSVNAVSGATVAGASQTGTTLLTQGWNSTWTNVLVAGDYIAWDTPSGWRELHMVTEAASSDSGGRAPLRIAPPIRESPANGAALILDAPSCVMRLATDTEAKWTIDEAGLYQISFSAEEAFSADLG